MPTKTQLLLNYSAWQQPEDLYRNNMIYGVYIYLVTYCSYFFRSCPTNTFPYNNLCYAYVSTYKTWPVAEAYCQTTYSGGHLASIHSSQDQLFLYNNVSRKCISCPQTGMWIGSNNYGNPSNWTWSDGTTFNQFPDVTRYSGWPQQPESPATQQCMTIV